MQIYSLFKKFRTGIEKKIHKFDARPVLANEEFTWAAHIEKSHLEIKNEVLQVLNQLHAIPNFDQILPNQRALYQAEQWKSFYLVAMGKSVPQHQRLCPKTSEALKCIPGLMNAFFSILQPGTHIPAHRGPYSGILRYHLGVIIPEGDTAIRVADHICYWSEGKSIFFDDSFEHEAWNKTNSIRVVLFVDMIRPLPGFLNLVNRAVLKIMAASSKEIDHALHVIFKNQI